MTIDLSALVSGNVFAFMLIFTRIGAIIMLMPGLGENFIPPRIRLQIALLISFLMLPMLGNQMVAMPASASGAVTLLGLELGTGLFIGTIMRIMLSVLDIVGMFIATQIGLANASIYNPTLATQGSITGAMLSLLGLVIIFESGLLEMLLRSLYMSYDVFKVGTPWAVGDMSGFISQTITQSFILSLKLTAPFMILGIAFQVVGGIMVKLIPQMQIFFVAAPLQILLGLMMIGLTLATMMQLWSVGFEESIARIFTGGYQF